MRAGLADRRWQITAAPARRGLGDGCAVGDGGWFVNVNVKVNGDGGWGMADGAMRSPEIGNQKQPLRSQRLSGNTHFDRRGAEGAEIERKREAGGGIRKAENRISDCGLRIGDWGARNSEFEKQKPPPRSQRLGGKNGPAERSPTEWRKLEGSVGPRSVAAKGDRGNGGRREAGGGRGLSTFHLKPSTQQRSAFTLIELLGVMAIIGILSAVILPPMIAKIEDAQTTNEDAKLEEIARALLAGIKAEGRIPNPNVNPFASGGWAAMATNYAVLGTNELIFSIPNSTNDTVRRYFLSPALTNFLAGNYTPPAGGWPTNNFTNGPLFFVLMSVSKDGLLFADGCATNTNTASNNVVFLQNWAKTNNPTNGRVPVNNLNIVGIVSGTTNRWTNQGQFLHVKVVDLKSVFCKVELEDFRSPPIISITNIGTNYISSPITQTTTNGFSLTITANSSSNLASVSFGSLPGKLIWSNTSAPYTLNITNGGGTNGQVYISFPPIPSFSVGALPLSPLTSQEESFYVLKGSLLNLTGSSSIIIQQDCKYQYLNDTWRQLY